jgi:hypothetical protein
MAVAYESRETVSSIPYKTNTEYEKIYQASPWDTCKNSFTVSCTLHEYLEHYGPGWDQLKECTEASL